MTPAAKPSSSITNNTKVSIGLIVVLVTGVLYLREEIVVNRERTGNNQLAIEKTNSALEKLTDSVDKLRVEMAEGRTGERGR